MPWETSTILTSTLKTEVIYSSETLVITYNNTPHLTTVDIFTSVKHLISRLPKRQFILYFQNFDEISSIVLEVEQDTHAHTQNIVFLLVYFLL